MASSNSAGRSADDSVSLDIVYAVFPVSSNANMLVKRSETPAKIVNLEIV